MIQLLFVFVAAIVLVAPQLNAQTERDMLLADPAIFYHEGTYYLYGTNAGGQGPPNQGIPVYVSTDLIHWEGPAGVGGGFALKAEDAFGDRGFWAPHVFMHNEQFYMAYTANESIALAMADSPLGPFTNTSMMSISAPVKMIDPFVFFDDDGKIYLYHVRVHQGNRLFVAEMNPDLMSIKTETLVECITAEEPWEDTANAAWKVVEGPTVLKRNGLYYMIYTANDFRNPDYAVGYAVADTPYGPWRKSPNNPIIHRSILNENGTGHGDVFFDAQGNMRYVLHTHFSETAVNPRKTALVDMAFEEVAGNDHETITIDKHSFRFLNVHEPERKDTEGDLFFYFSFDGHLNDMTQHTIMTSWNRPSFVPGKYGQAISLNGSSQWLEIYSEVFRHLNISRDPFTLCAWVYNHIGGDDIQVILSQTDQDGIGRIFLERLDANQQYRLGSFIGGSRRISTGAGLTPWRWHHIAIAGDPHSRMLTFYMDGIQSGHLQANAFEGSTGNYRIGVHKSASSNYWSGRIDELYLFSRVLTGEDILKVMNNEWFSPNSIPAVRASKDILIYPNPASHIISVTGEIQVSHLQLFDMTGRMLRIADHTNSIYVSGLPYGQYLLRIICKNDTIYHRMVLLQPAQSSGKDFSKWAQ